MTRPANSLLEEALRLPERERADFAAKLIESLEPAGDDQVEAAWAAEIQQRLHEIQTGEVQPMPWSEARRLILDDTEESPES